MVVVGGQARGVGKTAVVTELIARFPDLRWTAIKLTTHGHGLWTADSPGPDVEVYEEQNPSPRTDTGRYLAAGAARALWIRARSVPDAMPHIEAERARAENLILESTSVMELLQPNLFLMVMDSAQAGIKDSARRFLPRANAVLVAGDSARTWPELPEGCPRFAIAPPEYVTDVAAGFVRSYIAADAR